MIGKCIWWRVLVVAVRVESQTQIVGDFRRNVLEADARAGDAFEADAVQGEARQLAHLDLPLHKRVCVGISVDAQEDESGRQR